jgi:hypothetical protein
MNRQFGMTFPVSLTSPISSTESIVMVVVRSLSPWRVISWHFLASLMAMHGMTHSREPFRPKA